MDCIFCAIVAGRLPASIVYEDEATLAFMDIIPATPGHLLVIPKAHYRNIFDTPPALAARVMQTATLLAPALQAASGCIGMNLYVANEAPAGQEVWHLHLHMLPRYAGDGFGLRFPPGYGRRPARAELDDWAARISARRQDAQNKEAST
jgi:histidine triad (HIT) family protein